MTTAAKTVIQRQIDATDKQIDRLVYQIYHLTDEEIRIVEQGYNKLGYSFGTSPSLILRGGGGGGGGGGEGGGGEGCGGGGGGTGG
jgi:uncharacterized membrane protein